MGFRVDAVEQLPISWDEDMNPCHCRDRRKFSSLQGSTKRFSIMESTNPESLKNPESVYIYIYIHIHSFILMKSGVVFGPAPLRFRKFWTPHNEQGLAGLLHARFIILLKMILSAPGLLATAHHQISIG